MAEPGRIVRISPAAGIPGGEVLIETEGFDSTDLRSWDCEIGGGKSSLVGASKRRTLAIIPGDLPESGDVPVTIEIGGRQSESSTLVVGDLLAEELHPVSNPAIDPKDGSLFVTRSGSRGQHLPVSIYRVDGEGEIEEFSGDVTNPTGIAFDPSGQMFVSSRLNGTVYRIDPFRDAVAFAQDLGVATGIAFDRKGILYVGDRSGTIYRVNGMGEGTPWATHEPSVSAYHLAFGPDDALYLTGPTVSSYEGITRFDASGVPSTFYRGLGRPQGLAFDTDGNLYVAASLRGRRGIVRISPDASQAEVVVAGMNVVGLCFATDGNMIVATTDSVYSVPFGVRGALLN
jgi:sugar lactone lactonase YvrE